MKEFHDEKQRPLLNMLWAVLESMNVHLFASDIYTDEILFISDGMKKHFHLGEDAEGSACWKVLHPEFHKRCDFCPLYRLLENPSATVEWEEQDAESGRYYKYIDRIVEWSDGEKIHLQYFTDITDAKLSEASIKRQLEQQKLMSDISHSFTSTLDTRYLFHDALKMVGEFTCVNQTFLAQYQREEGILECLYEWCDSEGRPFVGDEYKWPITPDMDIYKNFVLDGYAAINDYSALTHPNFQTVRDYDLGAFLNIPIEISGQFWGILGFIVYRRTYDWTESDIHLGSLLAGVFSGAIRRSITEKTLLDAKRTAEDASKAKGDFLSSMSHEIRTPLNAIIGMTRIARNSADPPKMEYCLERINSASVHLLGLINDILDMSKIEANKLELSPAEFDFEKMLRDVMGVVTFRAEEKKQNLVVNIGEGIPPAFIGDEMRLSQVVVNLLSNAVKFTPEDGVIIVNVRLDDLSDGIAALLFEVIDNGIGISKEQQDRLFNPFEQADGSTARKYGGTGLGLTISKGIVELMGGRIWIESELGGGSKFSFIVKLTTKEDVPGPKLADMLKQDDIRILVVERVPEIRDCFARVASEFALTCDACDSGSAALELIGQKKDAYNFFFVDWTMPDFDGIELTKQIKQLTENSKVILMITETDWGIVEKNAVATGVSKFVFKPLFPSRIMNAISESMNMAQESENMQAESRVYDFVGATLLVAEDIEINREIVAAILENTKIAIDFASNGAEALSLVEKNPKRYQLILMDIQMPVMNGLEATKKIRALDVGKVGYIPIIAMTASVFREDIDNCMLAGMDDHIGKPLGPEELLLKLEHYLSLKPAPITRAGGSQTDHY